MRRRVYGQSKVDKCLFCKQQATTISEQKVPVCRAHTRSVLGVMRCVCNKFLESRSSKWGLFFTCTDCGSLSLRKVLEFNKVVDVSVSESIDPAPKKKVLSKSKFVKKKRVFPAKKQSFAKNNILTVRSDDPRFFD